MFLSHRFSAWRAHREPSWTRSSSSSWGSLYKSSQPYLIVHKAPPLYVDLSSNPTTQLGSPIQGLNIDSDGFFRFSAPRSRLVFICYLLVYVFQQTRASFSVGCLFVRLFVCLSVGVCLFLCYVFIAVQRPILGLFYLLSVSIICCKNRSALASSGRHGEHDQQPQAVIKNCPVFAGRNKESFQKYRSKRRVSLSLYSKAVLGVFQAKAQPSSSTLSTTHTVTHNAVAEHQLLQANQDFWSVLLLTTSGFANNAEAARR